MSTIKTAFLLLTMLFCLISTQSFAQTDKCMALGEDGQKTAQQLLGQIHGYGCCTETLSACLNKSERTEEEQKVLDEFDNWYFNRAED